MKDRDRSGVSELRSFMQKVFRLNYVLNIASQAQYDTSESGDSLERMIIFNPIPAPHSINWLLLIQLINHSTNQLSSRPYALYFSGRINQEFWRYPTF